MNNVLLSAFKDFINAEREANKQQEFEISCDTSGNPY